MSWSAGVPIAAILASAGVRSRPPTRFGARRRGCRSGRCTRRTSVTYRVVHCGRGAVGTAALQGILAHPDLELVGHHVWSPEKLGVDSGKLVGSADTA